MILKVDNKTKDFESYRAQRVKSLFNAEDGSQFKNEFNVLQLVAVAKINN